MKRSILELHFKQQLLDAGLDWFVEEYQFKKGKRWRFDFAFLDEKIAVECEGGIWSGGRHVTGKGFESDCYKYNEALILGWRVLRVTGSMINSPNLEALRFVQSLLNKKSPGGIISGSTRTSKASSSRSGSRTCASPGRQKKTKAV